MRGVSRSGKPGAGGNTAKIEAVCLRQKQCEEPTRCSDLTVLSALEEDLSLVPSIYTGQLKQPITPVPWSLTSSILRVYVHTQHANRHINQNIKEVKV